MHKLLLTLLFASVNPSGMGVTPAHPSIAATAACPRDDSTTRHQLNLLLKDARHSEFRSEISLPPLDTTAVRVLTDSLDAAKCTVLNTDITPQGGEVFIYYTAGDYYFAVSGANQPLISSDGSLHNGIAPAHSLYVRASAAYLQSRVCNS